MNSRISAKDCQVLVVDIQSRLAPALLNVDAMLKKVSIVLESAKALSIPITVAEQYPKGLGSSVDTVQPFINNNCFEKTTFSCFGAPALTERLDQHLQSSKNTLIIIGCEAHVCAAQTVLDAISHGYRVVVVIDAVSSRTKEDKDTALTRLSKAGAEMVTAEILVFEWVEGKDSPTSTLF